MVQTVRENFKIIQPACRVLLIALFCQVGDLKAIMSDSDTTVIS